MSEVSKSLIVTFDALNLVKGIKSVGGPDKQVYYIESNIFAPDRRITPLILQPYILVEDPHEIIASGDKVGELSSAKWYFDEIKSENRITAKEENASIDTPFALGVNNSLHIRKNVEKAIQLFFEAEYLDIRKNKNIHISLTYLLTTTSSSEVKPAPKLKLSKPQSWKYCPLDKVTEATIEAEVFADNKGYKSAIEWCKVEGDKVTPLSNEPFVLGGQNTDKLKVNPSLMNDSLILARNLSEKAYNKAYGINPDWDSKMSEVFENRNLVLNSDEIRGRGYWIGNKNISEEWIVGEYYTVSLNPVEIKEDNYLWFYANTGIGGSILTLNKSNNYSGTFLYTDKIPPTTGKNDVLTLFQKQKDGTNADSLVVIKNILVNKSKTLSPYTPAPEDLNFRNILVNGDFRNGVKGWISNASKHRILDGILESTPVTLSAANSFGSYHPVISEKNDIIYSRAIVKATAATKSKIGLEAANMLLNEIEANRWISVSGIGIAQFKDANSICYYTSYGWTEQDRFYIKSCFSINLTKIFGYGNEPSKEILDAVFINVPYIPSPYDIAPDGIIPGEYQTDIKFTKYFPEINAEILFLTGDSIRPENKVVKAQAIFTTNKEPINNPSEFFDIEWYLDPVEAGGAVKKIGTGEFMEIPVSGLQLKGGRLVPIRLKYNFK